jgi:hypothetical protein
MRNVLLIAVLTALLVGFTGCGKELNDGNFVNFWLELVKVDSQEEADKILDDYGWTDEEFETYFNELMADEERVDKLIVSIAEKNEDAAFALLTVFVGAKIDDAKFVEVWLKTFDEMDDEAAYATALKEYDLTPDDINAFIKNMLNDEDRLQKITADITNKDIGAGLTFASKVLDIGMEGLNP